MVSTDTVIPTREEQANLLTNVEEVFEQIKLLTKDEARSTDISVIRDVGLLSERAGYTLKLLEEVAQLRLSSGSNSVCMLDARPIIARLTAEGRDALGGCLQRGGEDVKVASERVANLTDAALERGQQLLDALRACSRRPGLGVISCYRGIIATDVVPVKRILLGAVEAHKTAHHAAIGARNTANECVDNTVRKYRDLMEEEVRKALRCVS
ncbi:hypothetical protein NQ318_021072 [Aromia moschata]|uniref:Uncharacterized protein n=1 Tax=Aromia moschata TaxID=1265417 RepID=A0AAV8YAW3_9CUCU|nr:hypothetical protein NQ318_021072 [Aromia moschata]